MDRYSFNTAYSQLMYFYGIELTPDEFENIAIVGWERIGNKEFKLYLYQSETLQNSSNEWYIDLPCNVDQIEAVTTNYEDYQKTSNKNINSGIKEGWTEGYIEGRKYNTNSLYAPGKYIKYRKEGNTLKFTDKFDTVNILYKGYIVDEEGLPYLNSKEVDAIAAFCAYVKTNKNALVSKDNATMQQAIMLEQKWKNLCTQARVPSYINQNDMDEILNVASSWDRKRFGKSFKPVR